MQVKCIRDLSEVIDDSKLRFGMMPPLGGELEPIGRVIPVGVAPRPRDVVVFGSEDADRAAGLAIELYSQGVMGVVSSRPITPFAGAFSLEVPCEMQGIRQLVEWSRSSTQAVVVSVVGDPGLCHGLSHSLGDVFGGLELGDDAWGFPYRALQCLESEEVALVGCTLGEIFESATYESLEADVVVLVEHADAGALNVLLTCAGEGAWVISTPSAVAQDDELRQAVSHHRMHWRQVNANRLQRMDLSGNSPQQGSRREDQEKLIIAIASNIKQAVFEVLASRDRRRLAS